MVEAAPKSSFFPEIVGLRIYLALWVALGHGLQLSGFMVATNPVLKILLNGHAAVVVFMIVSGFVITNLVLGKQESYTRYVTRRFFRLYPAYVVCCVAGYFMADDWLRIVQEAPWQGQTGWAEYATSIYELNREIAVNFWPHVGVHAAMLHGAVPDQVLNRAAMTFLPAAWSISLEWQFYLVAPFVLSAVGSRWRLLLVIVAALALHLAYQRGLLGSYDIGSALAGTTPYFAVGIVSRLAFDRLAALNVSPLLASAGTLYAIVAMVEEALPFAVWAVFLCFLLWHRHDRLLGGLFRALTGSKPATLLGEASYSLYLIHRPVQVALGALAMGAFTLDRQTMFAVQVAAIAIALPLSIAMYFAIERPGISLGRKAARGLPRHPSSPAAARA